MMDSSLCDIQCDLCGKSEFELFSVSNATFHNRRYKCLTCGLVASWPQATKEQLENYYSIYYPQIYKKILNPNLIKKRLEQDKKHLQRMFPEPGKLMDVGCASGDYLEMAKEIGWDVQGIELSKKLADKARERVGANRIFIGDIKKGHFPNETFDLVRIWHVIEHVPSPKELMLETYRILKKNGKILIGTPNIDEPDYQIKRAVRHFKGKPAGMATSQEHTFEFSEKTLSVLIEKCGFKVLRKERYYLFDDQYKPTNWKDLILMTSFYSISKVMPGRMGNLIRLVAVK